MVLSSTVVGLVLFSNAGALLIVDGWTELRLSTHKSSLSNADTMTAAGYLEGFVTAELILAAFRNFAGTGSPLTPEMLDLVEGQMTWMHEQIKANPADTYWMTMALNMAQWDGIIAGFNAASSEKLTMHQLMAYVFQFEIGDYAAAVAKPNQPLIRFDDSGNRHLTHAGRSHPVFQTNQGRRKLEGEHCSVLVRLPEDRSTLLAGHVTWSEFSTMLRIFKTYSLLDRPTISFSSYPALQYSGDDWHLVGQLLVTETTNEIYNMSLYKAMTKETIPYWLRIQAANALSKDAVSWHKTFSRYNNGGYNNQWMILDYSLFKVKSNLAPNTFVVGEQAPGFYHFEDQSEHLNKFGYWGSYNVPFYASIYSLSGYPAMYQKFGNFYSHDNCARATIYRRDYKQVQMIEDLRKLQRYNRWQSDPLSLGDACRGISARCDLNDPLVTQAQGCRTNTTMNGFSAFGAIDGKVVDDVLMASLTTIAVAGPSWQDQPPFAWTTTWANISCIECPRVYAFDWRSFVGSKE